jgi:hypothetical protein
VITARGGGRFPTVVKAVINTAFRLARAIKRAGHHEMLRAANLFRGGCSRQLVVAQAAA